MSADVHDDTAEGLEAWMRRRGRDAPEPAPDDQTDPQADPESTAPQPPPEYVNGIRVRPREAMRPGAPVPGSRRITVGPSGSTSSPEAAEAFNAMVRESRNRTTR